MPMSRLPMRTSFCLDHVAIAIPVRNEARRIRRLLVSLARSAERVPWPVEVTVLANNCVDESAAITRAFQHPALRIAVHEVTFSASMASAGRARRVAMDAAARPGGLLMTTDADAICDPDWIRCATDAVQNGADVVCGAITAKVPHVLATTSGMRITRAEASYCRVQHDIRHLLDQMVGRQPLDAQRPHYMESGASMAIRADRYLAIGGLPALDHSEDRALVYRAEKHGLSVRYASDMHARVSARVQGRAEGGMAACLRHRMTDSDPLADQAMLSPPVLHALWRDAMAGGPCRFPDRSVAQGRRLRASDLEAMMPSLQRLYDLTVLPEFAEWTGPGARMVAK